MAQAAHDIIIIESFYGGSHKQLTDLLARTFNASVFTLPAKKWPWRMRTSALHFALSIPKLEGYKTLFASATLNLCDLIALREDLRTLRKVLYFHENQLVYPVRKQLDRDFQFGYSQIISCLVADCVLFNSHFNMDSFLSSITSFLNMMPDFHPKGVSDLIKSKCRVLYFPLDLPDICTHYSGQHNETTPPIDDTPTSTGNVLVEPSTDKNISDSKLHIIWPHRWEHDKNPEEFGQVLLRLKDMGMDFKVSVLGKHSGDTSEEFGDLLESLDKHINICGFVDRPTYWSILARADVVVSTAKHEFFGVAMLEAVHAGCYPLCPNRLVYPEIYPAECIYNTQQQLVKLLKNFCMNPKAARGRNIKDKIDWKRYTWTCLKDKYEEALYTHNST